MSTLPVAAHPEDRPKASAATTPSLDDRYTLDRGSILVSGTQALVRLPMIQRQRDLARGLNTAGYVSGYRGSPLAGFDREMARAKKYLDDHHVRFQPGLNEDMAATAVWGTQQTAMFPGARYDGVFAMWYGKGPGVDRSMDVIRHANAVGTNPNGGVLLLVGDDHGAVSSTLPHQSEHNLISAMVPLLSPAGVGEYIDYGLLGWALSRYSGAWVGFKCQTEIVECTATVELDPDQSAIVYPDGNGDLSLRWPDGPHAMERRLENKMEAIHAFARQNSIDRTVWGSIAGKARLGIVSTGKSWLDLMGALASLGIDERRAGELGIRLYKIGMVWPIEPEGLQRFASGVETLLVVEEKRAVIEDQIKAQLFNMASDRRPRIYGKFGVDGRPLLSAAGEINAVAVARAIVSLIGEHHTDLLARSHAIEAIFAASAAETPALKRDPYFCSGCPHSISTRLPEGSRASTGIGCHMMVIGLEERNTSTFTQMGGEGGAWIGLSQFTDEKHIFVNMGDGTYFHSGLLAIRAAIAAKVNATYKILYNDAVAMTGGQKHDGEVSVPGIVGQMLAEGAARVAVVAERPEVWQGNLPSGVTINHRDELDAVQRELREVAGVTVLVYDQVCAAEKRRRRKRGALAVSDKRAFINELVCEGCGDCSAVSNCISIEPQETEFGRKRRINQSSCNTDLSCIKGFCPSFVTVEGGTIRKPDAKAGKASFDDLPLPAIRPITDRPYNMLLAGIGGTGVITVSAIVSMAAHMDGLAVQTLDQTGLAQKNGAVISHLRVARTREQITSVRIGPGESDLVLGFDIVVSAAQNALSTFAFGRTRAVLDDHFAPTASFVQNTAIDFRQEATLKALRRAAGDDAISLIAATKLGAALMGDAIAANMFLLGHAWQRGLVPISLEAVDKAIELNGTGIAMNRAAFGWGRRSVVDPEAVKQAAAVDLDEAPAKQTLDDLVAKRIEFLTHYQNTAYANKYRKLVTTARNAEARAKLGEDFSGAVARNAFKLMAYKDEYEVARLHNDRSFKDKIAAQFEGDFEIKHHLAPPLFSRRIDKRTGNPAKIAISRKLISPAFSVLEKLRFLRGTPLDPFGYTHERRTERKLVADYTALINDLSANLSPENQQRAIALAQLPDQIRGFGPVKSASIERFEKNKAALLMQASSTASQPADTSVKRKSI
ncbi:indolepyruvate ferredoxin oxidoreductase family protein [Rhizobium rhizogenes]|uniref:Indolepyruvate ferredoxin oxidoreductase chain alpha n=1 Tax=Rhizobium rhizogenes (strain K84 / ATCC BAA-868) TaxID=311403 RepID=B9JLX0_RHIR8|nr:MULTISPECIES: indolepyruvate ferredoxin oxidoreductase family protein [Rhizobium]ACM28684.1 indolepyruvate ferredoxin oxidoreductase chain alpha [Rhizobium rhizogenes K84]OCJ19043.1 indolepyruvate ferredoxin oxidoreductase [Agrobacterium sp. B131/95]EJK87981.1 indolepyruvate ferredoxin oxidreductase, alpha/beta subunit [Rhizobium sp. AP16]NTF83205.1 indolepyruvate ferredoxin oxidoreductase family protein [Rhizobium rhizogenes]NTG88460.1 indolepyruvate ferredoxin oxidoreductase family protei